MILDPLELRICWFSEKEARKVIPEFKVYGDSVIGAPNFENFKKLRNSNLKNWFLDEFGSTELGTLEKSVWGVCKDNCQGKLLESMYIGRSELNGRQLTAKNILKPK